MTIKKVLYIILIALLGYGSLLFNFELPLKDLFFDTFFTNTGYIILIILLPLAIICGIYELYKKRKIGYLLIFIPIVFVISVIVMFTNIGNI